MTVRPPHFFVPDYPPPFLVPDHPATVLTPKYVSWGCTTRTVQLDTVLNSNDITLELHFNRLSGTRNDSTLILNITGKEQLPSESYPYKRHRGFGISHAGHIFRRQDTVTTTGRFTGWGNDLETGSKVQIYFKASDHTLYIKPLYIQEVHSLKVFNLPEDVMISLTCSEPLTCQLSSCLPPASSTFPITKTIDIEFPAH